MTVTLEPAQFEQEVLRSATPVLVDFGADWCAPCRALAPVVDALAIEFQGRAKVLKIDVEAAPELAARYRVQSIPCVVFFSGGEEVSRVVGASSKAKLSTLLEVVASA